MTPNLYAPWREPIAHLTARTVGQHDVLAGLAASAREFAAGGRPLHRYVFGPRGVGKSHALAVATSALDGVEVLWLPEDIPATRRPSELLAQVAALRAGAPGWTSWPPLPPLPPWLPLPDTPPLATPSPRPTVLVIEGLDRRLSELGVGSDGREHRRQLRAQWDHDPRLWVVGSGVGLPTPMTDAHEAFFGWFHADGMQPLTEVEAASLLDRVSGRAPDHVWSRRRAALVAAADGSPRTLTALALACRVPEVTASEALRAAVERFTPALQAWFRELAPQAQAVVDALAQAPREVSPSEIAERLGWEPAVASKVTGRLCEEGVLARRRQGAHAWLRVVDPMARFWLGWRTGPWKRTRVAVAMAQIEAAPGLLAMEPDVVWERSGGVLYPEIALAAGRTGS